MVSGYAFSFLPKQHQETAEGTPMNTAKVDSAHKKIAQDKLTFVDVRQAARAGLKALNKFVLTGTLPITK